MLHMLAKIEAAARHRPIAHGPDGKPESVRPESRRPSETRLQAAVVGERNRDAEDLYADMPCTD
jgi:hypothetical protein